MPAATEPATLVQLEVLLREASHRGADFCPSVYADLDASTPAVKARIESCRGTLGEYSAASQRELLRQAGLADKRIEQEIGFLPPVYRDRAGALWRRLLS